MSDNNHVKDDGGPANTGKDIVQCLIGHDVELQGDITITGGLHIDGKVIGNITVREGKAARMTLSTKGVIDGNVTVNDADINGTIRGDVHARGNVTLYSHSRVEGDVYYQALEIKRGARINGRLIALSDSSSQSGSGLLGRLRLNNTSSQKQSA